MLHFIGPNMLCSFHAAHEWHRNIHLNRVSSISPRVTWYSEDTYENDIKRSVLLNSSLERLNSQRPVLSDFNNVAVFFENLHRQFLVDQVILREEDVKRDIIRSGYRANSARLQSRNEGRCQVCSRHRCCYLRADTVIQTPLHCNDVSNASPTGFHRGGYSQLRLVMDYDGWWSGWWARGGMEGHVQELTRRSGCTVDVHTLGGFQSIRWKISDFVTDIEPIQAYHV